MYTEVSNDLKNVTDIGEEYGIRFYELLVSSKMKKCARFEVRKSVLLKIHVFLVIDTVKPT
jgi:hypothetical protein